MTVALPLFGTISYAPKTNHFPTLGRFGRHLLDHVFPHERNNYHPHLLGHRALGLFSLLLLSIKIATVALLTIGPVLPAESSAITKDTIFSLTNDSRVAYSLNPLTLNNKLAAAAQSKADDMAAKGYFSHNTPDGKTPWDFIKKSGYSYVVAGENLAVDFIDAEPIEDAWMASPGHRANILNKSFEEIGIGIATGTFQGHTSTFVVQMFGTGVPQQITTLAKTTEVAPAPSPAPSRPAPAAVPVQTVAREVALQEQPLAVVEAKPAELTPVSNLTDNTLPASVLIEGGKLTLTAFSKEAQSVSATIGSLKIDLTALGDGKWQTALPLADVPKGYSQISLEMFNKEGQKLNSQVASFATDSSLPFSLVPKVAGSAISLFGKSFSETSLNTFYAIFAVLILVALVIAIAIHRHVQHIGLVANSAFVASFALVLWVTSL